MDTAMPATVAGSSVASTPRCRFHSRNRASGTSISGLTSSGVSAIPARRLRPPRISRYAPPHDALRSSEYCPSTRPWLTGAHRTNAATSTARHGRPIGAAIRHSSQQFTASRHRVIDVHIRYATSNGTSENGTQVSAKSGGLKYGSPPARPVAAIVPCV
jgi:hypothetical protein